MIIVVEIIQGGGARGGAREELGALAVEDTKELSLVFCLFVCLFVFFFQISRFKVMSILIQ